MDATHGPDRVGRGSRPAAGAQRLEPQHAGRHGDCRRRRAAFGVAYLLDGATHNNPYDNLNLPLPFPDALQEFKLETSTTNANNGMHSGASVNVVTKSGTNLFTAICSSSSAIIASTRPIRSTRSIRPPVSARAMA